MRWSQTFIPTLKETPADAEIVSHQLLLRAGLVRKLTGGLYTLLPAGLRAFKKIETIIREEMNRAGAVEVLMPVLQPPEIWQASGRYTAIGDGLFKVKDSARREWVLSPTAEEVITTLAAGEINSYRQLPVTFYQIGVKLRDEIRPRFGLMRAKEFYMKDAYSFDRNDEGAMASYRKMYDAYTRIFDRCGLRAFPVEADTGIIGGNYSHEFMVPAESGENDVVYCESGEYAANIEKATSRGPQVPTPTASTGPVPERFPTPGIVTIEALERAPYSVAAHAQIKTLIYVADSKVILILMRGDDQLNEAKLLARIGAKQVRPATPEECFSTLGARPGSLGAVVNVPATVQVCADEQLRGAKGMTTGANEDGFHFRHVEVERDIKVTRWADFRSVKAGELCTSTGRPLKIRRAIEVGHVFKLGTKYSEKLNSRFLDEAGQQQLCIMGCYGIGITRTLQAVIEQSHDKDGILWPKSIAPFAVCITPLNVSPGGPIMELAEKFYRELTEQGVEAILDDRDDRPGVKFKDADLVGFPFRLAIGEKGLAKGVVEIKPRGGELTTIAPDQAVARLLELVRS